MFRFLRNRWYAHLRRIDIEILWPSCRKLAPDLDHAKAAFAAHAFQDEAWLALGEEGIVGAIEGFW